VTFAILVLATLLSRVASVAYGSRGLLTVFGMLGVLLLVGIPLTAPAGPPANLRSIVGLGLFLTMSLGIVAIPLRRLNADVPTATFLKIGLQAAVVSTLIAPFLLLFMAGLFGDGL
jgi:hypothetical protein